MKLWIKWGLIGFGVVLVVSALSLWLLARSWRLEFEEEVRRLEKSGAPTHPSQLAPPPVPDAENAAIVIAEAARLLEEFKDDEKPDWDGLSDGKVDPEPFKTYVGKRTPALEKLALALQRPRCRFPVDYSMGILTDLSHVSSLAEFARTLEARAVISSRAGDHVAALRDVKLLLRLSECLAGEPLLISQLVRYVIRNEAFEVLQADKLDLPAEEWKALARAFEAPSLLPDLASALRMERASAISLIENYYLTGELPTRAEPFSGGGRLLGFVVAKSGTHHLRVMARAIDLAQRPYSEARAGELAFQNDTDRAPGWREYLSRMLLPALMRSHQSEARAEAQQRMAAAFCRIKAEGRAPESLDLIDPCTGKPFLYTREGKAFQIRSLGPNQKDDDGNPDKYDSDDLLLKSPK